MKIFALMLLKNEADIVEEVVTDALTWCDRIGVLDNGSEDGSYAIVKDIAARHPGRIELCGVYYGPYNNDLRLVPFRVLRPEARPGDWWCRLDADEMYPFDPRAFLGALPASHCRVNAINLFYAFTDRDLANWDAGLETLADRKRPIRARRRYYRASYQELRFMRHDRCLRWRADEPWPTPRGPLSPQAILMQHFRARDPAQIQARIRSRMAEADAAQKNPRHHWRRMSRGDWHEHVSRHEKYHYDKHEGIFEVDYARFRAPVAQRFGQLLKRGLYRCGLRL